ncbi:MAG TPA: glucose-6-phosphate dehydrogenase assembly protein OpcA [Streptosporangiaceae bacterium]|nr:glucose-6-phosphate dehydrogenase assembly protein OpcA [Streptosporangiaceae bacterium]
MTIDLTDTSTGAILETLMQARLRMGGPALGMVLTLIVVTDEASQYDAIRAASQAAREHPCRVLGVIIRTPSGRSRLDAEIRLGESGPGQMLLLRMYGPLAAHADSVVAPLILLDTPVVTWWPGAGPAIPSADPLGALAQRRVTDAAAADKPRQTLASLASSYRPGDTDLSWTRATPWRSLLAATLDQSYGESRAAVVSAEHNNPTADLLATWLAVRLGIEVRRDVSAGPGITSVTFDTPDGQVSISRPDGRTATLNRPGQQDRRVALHRRDTAELLAEELRRLDPDEVYGEVLARFASHPPGEGKPGEGKPSEGKPGEGKPSESDGS